jgi:hypothetical protein
MDGNGDRVVNDEPFVDKRKPSSTSAVKSVLNNGEHTLIPVTVKMIYSAVRDCKRFVLKDGRPLHMVKLVESSGRLCFSVGSNYNRKKLQPEKKVQSSGRQLETGKNYVRKKGTVISSRRLEGKTQNTTHIIDTTTNKMSCATLPSSGFAPYLTMSGAVAPPNHGTAGPQRHAQAATCQGCACCRWFARLGRISCQNQKLTQPHNCIVQ